MWRLKIWTFGVVFVKFLVNIYNSNFLKDWFYMYECLVGCMVVYYLYVWCLEVREIVGFIVIGVVRMLLGCWKLNLGK